jgi:hypothetical protein
MNSVPATPITYPALKKAFGMARIPVPRLPFSKCSSVSVFLWETKRVKSFASLSMGHESLKIADADEVATALLSRLLECNQLEVS